MRLNTVRHRKLGILKSEYTATSAFRFLRNNDQENLDRYGIAWEDKYSLNQRYNVEIYRSQDWIKEYHGNKGTIGTIGWNYPNFLRNKCLRNIGCSLSRIIEKRKNGGLFLETIFCKLGRYKITSSRGTINFKFLREIRKKHKYWAHPSEPSVGEVLRSLEDKFFLYIPFFTISRRIISQCWPDLVPHI